MTNFYVYILKCSDESFYTGHTDNLEKRLSEHQLGLCEGYTSTRLPVELVFSAACSTRYEALAYEHKIKRWSRKKKEALIQQNWQTLIGLAKKSLVEFMVRYIFCKAKNTHHERTKKLFLI